MTNNITTLNYKTHKNTVTRRHRNSTNIITACLLNAIIPQNKIVCSGLWYDNNIGHFKCGSWEIQL